MGPCVTIHPTRSPPISCHIYIQQTLLFPCNGKLVETREWSLTSKTHSQFISWPETFNCINDAADILREQAAEESIQESTIVGESGVWYDRASESAIVAEQALE